MGAVYECRHTETGERFAIKVLSPELAAVPAARARFLKEARLTARVSHPHIVHVTDVGEDAGRSYLVMPMLEGEDLARRLEGFGSSLSAAETVDIMLPVCDAVAEAHACGVTHRDLKPSNIFLTIRDQRSHPIVLDFGIAKDEDAASIWDSAGAGHARRPVFGTPYYLAPEQVVDHRAAGPASDQHALGVILYECLTGQPPYREDSVEKLFRAIAAGNPIPPSARELGVPDGLDAVVLRALATDPNKRFDSVAELGRALRPFASKPAASKPTASKPAATVLGTYRRKPSSPAIQAEAATPSPFVRTLTPEVEKLSGSWFEAPVAPQEAANDVELPPVDPADPALDETPPLWTQLPVRKLASRRIWIGAGAGSALLALVLAIVATRAKPSTDSVAVQNVALPPPAEPMPVQAAVPPPAAAPSEPAAPAPSEVPAPAPSEPTAAAAKQPTPAAAKQPTPAAPQELTAAAPKEVPAPAPVSRARKSGDRSRARGSDGIRMHNGVPLLD